ncbi:MAG: hypothetical protein KF817_02830 [Phycisphaeraceae bacterium]|nr:hypothetical protein [Phycisphaeraceae bacterium]
MADPNQRIIVDGIDFAALFRFPLILRQVVAALQPPRLLVGILVAACILGAGSAWDRFVAVGRPDERPAIERRGGAEPAVASLTERLSGAACRSAMATERDAARRAVLESWVPPDALPSPPALADARTALTWLERGARARWPERWNRSDADRAAYADAWTILAGIPDATPFAETCASLEAARRAFVSATLSGRPSGTVGAIAESVIALPRRMFGTWPLFSAVMVPIVVGALVFGGGMLARMTACDIGGGERISIREAAQFARAAWRRLLSVVLIPPGVMAGLSFLLLVPALMIAVPILNVVGGALWGLALIVAVPLVLLAALSVPAAVLAVPAAVSENMDAVDSLQRAISLMLRRPLHLLFYAALVLIGLAAGSALITAAAAAVRWVPMALAASAGDAWTVPPFLVQGVAPGPIPARPLAWHESVTGTLIGAWGRIVLLVAAGWHLSYMAGALTSTFLLLRRAAVGQDLAEIWRPGLIPGTLVPVDAMAPVTGGRLSGRAGRRPVLPRRDDEGLAGDPDIADDLAVDGDDELDAAADPHAP